MDFPTLGATYISESYQAKNMRQLAIITGATRGLGLALTQRLLAEGMRVVAIGRRLDNLKRQKEEYGDGTQRSCSGGNWSLVWHWSGDGAIVPRRCASRADRAT